MPLYECECTRCDQTFEVLAPVSESGAKGFPCPACGRRGRRMLSAVTFGRPAGAADAQPPESRSAPSSRSDVTKLKVPPPAQICWMDGPSSARYAAHLHGRGAEYDETVAARTELGKQRGATVSPTAAHDHAHSHSPLADPAVYARRRAAATRAKKTAPAK
jgi:putative FmdB family regulatory protein